MATGTNGRMKAIMAKIKERGFKLACPACGDAEATITLDLTDLATCHCESCGDSFAVTTAVKLLTERLAQWLAVERWIDLAPGVKATPQTESKPDDFTLGLNIETETE